MDIDLPCRNRERCQLCHHFDAEKEVCELEAELNAFFRTRPQTPQDEVERVVLEISPEAADMLRAAGSDYGSLPQFVESVARLHAILRKRMGVAPDSPEYRDEFDRLLLAVQLILAHERGAYASSGTPAQRILDDVIRLARRKAGLS